MLFPLAGGRRRVRRALLLGISAHAGHSDTGTNASAPLSGGSIDTIFELYSSEQACSQIFQPYLPSADQARLRQDTEAGVEATSTALEGTALASIPDLAARLRELVVLSLTS